MPSTVLPSTWIRVVAEQAARKPVAFGQYEPRAAPMNRDKEDQADGGGTGERGGQREENRRDNPRRLDHGKEQKSPQHLDTRELPEPQKEDARRRQESGGRKG
jgi:hypothetical protein